MLSVLVYDCDTDEINFIQDLLKDIESGWSAEVHAAGDHETFETLLDQREFHIVFLTQELGSERQGLDVLKELRSGGYQRPVILIAEDGSQQLAARSFRHGVNDYLVREELTSGELKRSIEYVLKNYFQYDKDESETDPFLLHERRDSLTGFYNRVSLENRLDDLCSSQQNIVLFLVGISNLERVNESHGQQVGDSVLEKFGDEIGSFFQDEKLLGRVQGGDFCVVIQGKGQGYAREEGQAFLDRLSGQRMEFDRRNNTPLQFVGCTVQKDNNTSGGRSFLCRGVDKLHKAKAGELEAQLEVAGN